MNKTSSEWPSQGRNDQPNAVVAVVVDGDDDDDDGDDDDDDDDGRFDIAVLCSRADALCLCCM